VSEPTILADRMRRELLKLKLTKVSLKLNIKKLYKIAQHRETYKKQSGGRKLRWFKLELADEVDGKAAVGFAIC
jgi:elongation factor G